MWSWLYTPQRLQKSYNKWLSAAASIDKTIIRALRLMRQNVLIYGVDTGHGPLLGPLCERIGLDPVKGDMSVTIPIPCSITHCGTGTSREYHALQRLRASFRFGMKVYLPIQLLTQLRTVIGLIRRVTSQPGGRTLRILRYLTTRVLRAAVRSSLFLATLIASFYYAVCLTRTRMGPHVLRLTSTISTTSPSTEIQIAQTLDSGPSVLAGCLACGTAIYIGTPSRRTENMLFVLPRALATLVPRCYDARLRWREQVVFAASVAIVVGGVANGSGKNVRGVFGRALSGLLAT